MKNPIASFFTGGGQPKKDHHVSKACGCDGCSDTDGTVRIGVGNTSNSGISIDVTDNLISGGRSRVHLASGNHAARANRGVISGNVADADDLLIGVDNYSAGGDNVIKVCNNDFRGFKSLQIGAGNYARGSNRIIIGNLNGN